MKRIAAASLSALLAVSIAFGSFTSAAEARNGRNAALGIGLGLGILGAAAIASSNRAYANDRPYYYSGGGGYRSQCSRWSYRCERGNDWACDKYDRNC